MSRGGTRARKTGAIWRNHARACRLATEVAASADCGRIGKTSAKDSSEARISDAIRIDVRALRPLGMSAEARKLSNRTRIRTSSALGAGISSGTLCGSAIRAIKQPTGEVSSAQDGYRLRRLAAHTDLIAVGGS